MIDKLWPMYQSAASKAMVNPIEEMEEIIRRRDAFWEGTIRLIAGLVNEALCSASIIPKVSDNLRWLRLEAMSPTTEYRVKRVSVRITDSAILPSAGSTVSCIGSHQLEAPVFLEFQDDSLTPRKEHDPAVIFASVNPWFGSLYTRESLNRTETQFSISTANQGQCFDRHLQSIIHNLTKLLSVAWLKYGETLSPLTIVSPPLDWETCLFRGHPIHPVFYPQKGNFLGSDTI